jgi:hypothetical protein
MPRLSNRPVGEEGPLPLDRGGEGGLYNQCMFAEILRRKAGQFFPYLRARPPLSPFLFLLILLSACQTGQFGTIPTGLAQAAQSTQAIYVLASQVFSTETATESGMILTDTPLDLAADATQPAFSSCTDNLTFMGDLTYPDRSPVLPGQPLEKRWKVRNSGSCDWGPEYRFRWVGGAALSPRQEFALFPAVSGSEAVISVLLTAPLGPGEYISSWRAFSPLGVVFGDTLYIDVVIS